MPAMLMRLTPFSIRYGCSVVLVKQFLVFLTITGSSARGRRKSISLNDGLSLAKPSSLSMCKKNTTGRWAVRYASTSWVTFFSKAGLLRRSQRGPTLNESCASITNNADCETGTLLESSMVSSSKHLQFNITVGTLSLSCHRSRIFATLLLLMAVPLGRRYSFTPERVALIPESPLVQRQP